MEQKKLNQETPTRAIPVNLYDDNPYVTSPTQRRVCIKVNPTPDNEVPMSRDLRNEIYGNEVPVMVYPVGERPSMVTLTRAVSAKMTPVKEVPIKIPDGKTTVKLPIKTVALKAIEMRHKKDPMNSIMESIKKMFGF